MKVLVVGAGYWGSKLLEKFVGLVGAENVVVYDKASELTIPWCLKGCNFYWSLEACIQSVDACVVATPPDSHFKIAAACLGAGKPTLVEKPMVLTATHARELVALAQAKHLTLMTDDTFLYTGWALKSLTKSARKFASVMETHWTGPRRADLTTPEEGILWTLGPHPVSLMLKAMGRYPISVCGVVKPRKAIVLYTFVGGDEASMFLEWDTPGRERYLWWRAGITDEQVDFDQESEREPLFTMCETFLDRAKLPTPWIDHHGLQVVETLEMTEKLCKAPL